MIIQHRRAIKRYRFQQVHVSAASFNDSRCSKEFHTTETELIIRYSTQSCRFNVFRCNYLAILTSFHSFCSLLLPTSSQKKTNRTPLQCQDYWSARIAGFYWARRTIGVFIWKDGQINKISKFIKSTKHTFFSTTSVPSI